MTWIYNVATIDGGWTCLIASRLTIPIFLPNGAVIDSVRVRIDQATATGTVATLKEFTPNILSTSALPVPFTVYKTATGNATTGAKTMTLTGPDVTIANFNNYYVLEIDAQANDDLYAADITWRDYGPSNY